MQGPVGRLLPPLLHRQHCRCSGLLQFERPQCARRLSRHQKCLRRVAVHRLEGSAEGGVRCATGVRDGRVVAGEERELAVAAANERLRAQRERGGEAAVVTVARALGPHISRPTP